MKIERRLVGTVEVCAPQGALVDEGGEQLSGMLSGMLTGPNPRVVIDMAEVGYLDSAALEGLLGAADELADRSQTVKLAAITPTVREVLELTGLTGRFQFFQDVDAAVRSFL